MSGDIVSLILRICYNKEAKGLITFTNEVCGKSSITKPSCREAVKEVLPIRRKVAFHGGAKHIVVARINT